MSKRGRKKGRSDQQRQTPAVPPGTAQTGTTQPATMVEAKPELETAAAGSGPEEPEPAAGPQGEMELSESVVNWMERGEQHPEVEVDEDGTTTRFDPRAAG